MNNDYDLPAHAKYGPSSMDRIINCPGSVPLSEEAPEERESEFASEGTKAHELGETCLEKEYWRLEDMLTAEELKELPDDMADAVNTYLDYTFAIKEECEVYGIEEKMVLNEELFGTVDFIAYSKGEDRYTMSVVDYKHGAGIAVSPDDNKQLLTYAALSLANLPEGIEEDDISAIELTIVQPRTGGDPVRTWVTSVERVEEHLGQVMYAIAVSQDPEVLHLSSGDHCRWCKAKIVCPRLAEEAAGIVAADPKDLSPEQLSESLAGLGALKMAINALEVYAQQMAEDGHGIPGWKLVDKRATAKWKNEAETLNFFKKSRIKAADYLVSKLVTPAAARKKFDRDLEDQIESKSSGVVLALESDKRPAAVTAGTMQKMATTMAAINKLN